VLVDDRDDVRLARAPDQVVGMKARVPGLVVAIGAERRQRVEVQPIAHRTALERTQVGIAPQHLACRLVEAQLLEVLVRAPLPDDVALPVDLDDLVVEQGMRRDGGGSHVLVHEQQRIAAFRERDLARREVAHRTAGALKVVVLARDPALGRPRIGDMFQLAEAPQDAPFPVDLHKIDLILEAVARIALPGAAEHLATRQELVREALQVLPQLHLTTVHVDQERATLRGLKQGVAAVRLGGIEHGDTGGVDAGMTHQLSPWLMRGLATVYFNRISSLRNRPPHGRPPTPSPWWARVTKRRSIELRTLLFWE
jgi:hypothetical protein